MSHRRLAALVLAVAAVLVPAPAAEAAPAPAPRYTYVDLGAAAVPDGFLFVGSVVALTDDRRVYAELLRCDDVGCSSFVATLSGGRFTVLREGVPAAVSRNGIVGGSVVTDADQGLRQAALFRGSRAELIPRRPGETTSSVLSVSALGSAVVESTAIAADGSGTTTYFLHRPGRANLPLPGPATLSSLGIIAGTQGDVRSVERAFRLFPPLLPTPAILPPGGGEAQSQAQAVNELGDVLGYSYTAGGQERIGFWRGRTFHTLFTQGTPANPTISSRLAWNERGLVAVSRTLRDDGPFLITRPGVRLDLNDLIDAPVPGNSDIVDVNERGDLLGQANTGELYLLRRVG